MISVTKVGLLIGSLIFRARARPRTKVVFPLPKGPNRKIFCPFRAGPSLRARRSVARAEVVSWMVVFKAKIC